MRIGYSYWGFLGDHKEDKEGKTLSTPDGNAAYGGFLIDAMQKAGHQVLLMQKDRDWACFSRRGSEDFASFSKERRFTAYLRCGRTVQGDEAWAVGMDLPPIDMLLLEWRFPIPGRNTQIDQGSPNFQPDLMRQTELIYRYRDVPIAIWDLDQKLTPAEEEWIRGLCRGPVTVLETSVTPRRGLLPRVRVEPPVAIADLRQLPPMPPNPHRKLVYVGSRYERDDVIDEWIKPVSDRFPGEVEFFGNWTLERNFAEVKARWPNVRYRDRISMKDFRQAYGDACGCPLLAKRGYLETGFITPRIWEALLFGTIPIGLASHHGIEQYLPDYLIADDPGDLGQVAFCLSENTAEERAQIRDEVIKKIEFMDASNFVGVLEKARVG